MFVNLVEGITHPFPRIFFASWLHAYRQAPAHEARSAKERGVAWDVESTPPTPLPLLPPFPLGWL